MHCMVYVVWPVLAGAFSQRLHERPLLGLKHTLKRQVHQAGTIFVHLPLQNREVALDRRRVGEQDSQAATERL